MRGYRILREQNHLDKIETLKNKIAITKFKNTDTRFSNQLLGFTQNNYELSLRQYLLYRLGGVNLNSSILSSIGSKRGLVYPLPLSWQKIIKKNGFNVNFYNSSILWFLYLIFSYFFGLFRFSSILFFSLINIFRPCSNLINNVYFMNLTYLNLPTQKISSRSYDIISWYIDWKNKVNNLSCIKHNVKNQNSQKISKISIEYQKHPIPYLRNLFEFSKFLLLSIIAFTISALDLLRGRWHNSVLLDQIILLIHAKSISKKNFSSEYLFHNSGWIYRPLWTYEAEKKGSIISFYFYSTNCDPFRDKQGHKPIPYGYNIMSWPRYLVWDLYQEKFVKNMVGTNARTLIVGPISFSDSKEIFSCKYKKYIAIFDVSPHRESRYRILGLRHEVYTAKYINNFLNDIVDIISKNKFNIVLKRKRNLGKILHPQYNKLINDLSKLDFINIAYPNISANHIIKNSVGVISFPYTSTAILADHLNKPSVYYDPSRFIDSKDINGSHGIKLITSKKNLENWIIKIIKNSQINN